jgi:hypothetical protein
LIPAVVPREWLPRATALASSGGQIAQIAGPALGGIGYGLGAGWIYCVAAALYLSAFASIATLVIERAPPRKEPTTWRTLFAGITFIFQRRLLLGTLSLDLFAVLLGGATALLPVFARDVLHVGAEGFGVLRAAPAVGATLVAIFLASHQIRRRLGPVHQRLQRAGRVRERRRGAVPGSGRRGCVRRRRGADRDGRVGADVPGAEEGRPAGIGHRRKTPSDPSGHLPQRGRI